MNPETDLLQELRIDRDAPPPKRFPRWIIVLLLLILVSGGVAAWRAFRTPAVSVRTMIVREVGGTGSSAVLNASGYVTPRREATVSSKVTGKVLEVLIEEGLRVTNGQVLARLDDVNVRASFDLAQAELKAAQSALEETQVRLEEAQREARRVDELATNKIATASDVDRAHAEVNSLQARLVRQEAEAVVAERQAALWRQQLEDTIIRAPFAGVIVAKNAQPGEMISPVSAGGGFTRTGICTIVDMDSLEIEVDVNESHINRVEAGQAVEATLDSYPDWNMPAKVIAIIPTADRQKATVRVRVGFERLDPRILPQMGVKVVFQNTRDTHEPRRVNLPATAVKRQGDQNLVFVVQDGRAAARTVVLGPARGREISLTSGLKDGDRVAVSGVEDLTDGVRIVEPKR